MTNRVLENARVQDNICEVLTRGSARKGRMHKQFYRQAGNEEKRKGLWSRVSEVRLLISCSLVSKMKGEGPGSAKHAASSW